MDINEIEVKGYKEVNGKLNYELDFDFITQMAQRMDSNKGKYEPFNWTRPIDIDSIKQSLFRHVMSIMKDDYADDNRTFGHIEAAACNLMIINYQLQHNKNQLDF